MKNSVELIPVQDVSSLIQVVRNARVILDADLAGLYSVSTKALNQAVKRNRARFPTDFIFRITPAEAEAMNRSQIVTGSRKHRDPRFPPYAFTEHGAIMVATILNSPRAVAMSVYVIRAFVKMREDIAANTAILKRLAEIDKTLLLHDAALRDIYQKLRPLLEPPPLPPKTQIGFHVKEDAIPYRIAKR
jgi:hypothetical protein